MRIFQFLFIFLLISSISLIQCQEEITTSDEIIETSSNSEDVTERTRVPVSSTTEISTSETIAPTTETTETTETSETMDTNPTVTPTSETTSTSETTETSETIQTTETTETSETTPPSTETPTSTSSTSSETSSSDSSTSTSTSTSSSPSISTSSTEDSTNSASSESSFESSSESSSFLSSESRNESLTSSYSTIDSTEETVSLSGVSTITQTNTGSTTVIYAIEGKLRLDADYNSIKNRTQFVISMSDSLTNYFGYATRVTGLQSGSIIVIYVVLSPSSDVSSIIPLITALANSDSFAGYDVIPPTSSPAVPSSARGNSNSSSTNVALIAAIVGGIAGAIIIAAIIIAVVILKKKRRQRDDRAEQMKKNYDVEKGVGNGYQMKEFSPLVGTTSVVTKSTEESSERRRVSDPKSWQNSTSTMISSNTQTLTSTSNQTPSHVFLKNIEVGHKLGSGTFGDVYFAQWGKSKTPLALKAMKDVGDSETERSFVNEVALLMKLNHPNVVRAMGVYRDGDGKLYLAMEYLSKGSLLSFLRRPEVRELTTTMDLVSMSIHVAAGMMYLEDKNIIHRDLAARNLLVTEVDGKFLVKIADLGLSRESDTSVYHAKEPVSLPIKWSPPEVIENNSYSHKSDVWSFAISLWEIFEYGKEPYCGMSNVRTMHAVIQEGYRLARPLYCPESIYNIMLRCWQNDPEQRPTFEEIWKELTEISNHLEENPSYSSFGNNNNSFGSFMKVEDLDNFLTPSNRAPTPLQERDNDYIRTFDEI